ncbi:MAG: TldD/PmbA family protein [Planctomycetes bacterium]|nr:TldD/PmbA family protein [Planctomycetota bacterium]
MRDRLTRVLSLSSGWAEARYHKRRTRAMSVRKGELTDMSSKHHEGVGLRVLRDGVWGFASTSDLSVEGLTRALKTAEAMARGLQSRKKERSRLAPAKRLAKGEFTVPGYHELMAMEMERKLDAVRQSESKLRAAASQIESASCAYSELFEEKWILTTDGADAHVCLVRPELRLSAFAADGARRTVGHDSVGATGSWECLFRNRPLEKFVDNAAHSAVDLLKAPDPEGGKKTVILAPSMVGLLSHEAIGHTVEADFVSAGSVAQGKIGQEVASPLITLCDSGATEHAAGAGGLLPVDDEGVLTERTTIIKEGRLVSYLHNRESAARYDVEPTGNARAWEFGDEPLIRMRNTYIEPGHSTLEEMITGVEDGYFIDGPDGGQADATGEFMFGANKVRRIRDGKLAEPVQIVTISGIAFEVLKSVDAVSSDFAWEMGAGYCGKMQPARVDAGGPYVRCRVLVGGRQRG